MSNEVLPDDHHRPTYDEIHVQIATTAKTIKEEFKPDLIVAIGGGGFYPARVLRTYLKVPSKVDPAKQRNIPIQAIGLSLYEELSNSTVGQIGHEVVRTQWLDSKTIKGKSGSESGSATPKLEEGKDAGGLIGKNILIVDEVDDSRTTLQYAYNELLKDVKSAIGSLNEEERKSLPETKFAIFVVHNKYTKAKRGSLPIIPPGTPTSSETFTDGVLDGVRYYSGEDLEDIWVEYPWEQEDILEHNRLAALAKKLGAHQSQIVSEDQKKE